MGKKSRKKERERNEIPLAEQPNVGFTKTSLRDVHRTLQGESTTGANVGKDPLIKTLHKTYGRVHKRRCAHCKRERGMGKGGGGGSPFKSCGGCGGAYYCDEECQKADWPSHRRGCKESRAVREGTIQAAVGNGLCSITPCDMQGLFALNGFFADTDRGKYAVTIHLRLGHGVENALVCATPGTILPLARAMPLSDFEAAWYKGADGKVNTPFNIHMGRGFAAARISRGLALSLLDQAEAERKTPLAHKNAVKIMRDGIASASAAAVSSTSRQRDLSASLLYRRAISHGEVVECVQRISALSFQELPLFLMKKLKGFEECLGITAQPEPGSREQFTKDGFTAEADLRAQGFSDHRHFMDVSGVLQQYDRIEIESAGGLHTRYKRVFEFMAAWLESARLASRAGMPLHGKPTPWLVHLVSPSGHSEFIETVAAAAYCSGVQCTGRKMFSSGCFLEDAQKKLAANAGKVRGEVQPDNEAIYQANKNSACGLTIALALRYFDAHGRPQVPMVHEEELGVQG